MANNDDSTLNVMKRFAIDPAGRLGSIYDGYRDCILGQLNVENTMKSYQSFKPAQCQIIKNGENLFSLIGIEEELQLSILLNLTANTGISSLIDYSHSICEFTRILYFRYENGEERSLNDINEVYQSLIPQISATHIITGIHWGISLLIILQLPSNLQTVEKIDDILEKIRITLQSDSDRLTLNTDDKKLLDTIVDTKIYSNISECIRKTTLYDVCYYIDQLKTSPIRYPLTYTLQSLKKSYIEYPKQDVIFTSIPSGFLNHIIKYLFQLLSKMKNFEIILNENLKKQFYDAHEQWLDVNKQYKKKIEHLSNLVIDFRSYRIKIQELKNALEDNNEQSILQNNMNDLTQNLKCLEAKGHFITDLEQHFKYCNVAECGIDKNDSKETIEQKLIKNEQCDRILCSNDTLNMKYPDHLNKLRYQLIKEYEENRTLHLIYADFSYSSFELHDMIILPTIKTKDISSSIVTQLQSETNETINILLLGETGVGKSTFINAFVNYLTFNSLETAESNKPVVLIPVSFIMTTGENFHEHIIKLDNIFSKTSNENFNKFGQSVTQYCQSYILDLKRNDKKKLRIIDTPGFGDTRGIEQDDFNMQHILEYIKNLKYLNAICFLFKPNNEQVNIYFRSSITQLFDYLGTDIRQNIIFCFTNSRTTFYTPGNLAPHLKTILNSLSMDIIPFKKDNTFCFDSESFRYLAALQNNIPLNNLDKTEYENSWIISMKESNRLINYIYMNLTTYYINDNRQSIKYIQFEIIHIIRPILEAIRNILRNIILWTSNSTNYLITLHPKPIHRPATQCLSCKPNPIQIGNFLILPDSPHEIHNQCLSCSCASNQHSPIEYILEYKYTSGLSDFEQMKSILHSLFDTSIEFAHFLKYVVHYTKDDPFLVGLTRMIEEEKDIYEKIQSNDFNLQLIQQLKNIIHDYKQKMKSNYSNMNLSIIHERIKTIREHTIINIQLTAIKQSQHIMMKYQEFIY